MFGEDHRARVVENAVDELDAEELEQIYAGVGSEANPPCLMLKMAIFEYLEGRRSPSQWCRDAREHVAVKWLLRGLKPSRSACYDFRNRMALVIDALNDDLIRRAIQEGLAAPVAAAQDGTTVRSQASRHRAVNAETLKKRRAKIDAAIAADEQQQPSPEPHPKWMPATPNGRLDLQRRMELAGQRLDVELRENQRKPKDTRRLEKNIVVSLTDLEATFARDKEKTFCFLYNVQFMVDCESLFVLGYKVSPEHTDVGTLPPMLDKVQPLIGGTLKRVSADASYTSLLDLIDYDARHVDVLGPVQSNSFTEQKKQPPGSQRIDKAQFVWLEDEQTYQCPAGRKLSYESRERIQRHGGRHVNSNRYRCPPEFCTTCPLKGRCAKNPESGRTVQRLEREELLEAQQAKMQSPPNKEAYRKRGQTIERAFADAKGHRNFDRLHGRGLKRAHAEVGLLVLAQNILALTRLRKIAKSSAVQTT